MPASYSKKETTKINDVYSVAWSRMNQAWFIIEFSRVIAIKPTQTAVEEWLKDHGQIAA